MARPDSDRVLSREELAELKLNLSRLSEDGVERVYQTAHQECRFNGGRLPPSTAIQQLVTAWRILRNWKRRLR